MKSVSAILAVALAISLASPIDASFARRGADDGIGHHRSGHHYVSKKKARWHCHVRKYGKKFCHKHKVLHSRSRSHHGPGHH